jgi:hypothetical protein
MARVRQARKCRARRKDGRPCGSYAVKGAYVCRMHGGAAGQVRRKAHERVIEAAAYRTLDAYLRSPAYQEAAARSALASDRPAVEAFAERLAGRR